MPRYYEDKEVDHRACSGLREDFKECLLTHDCVVKVRTLHLLTVNTYVIYDFTNILIFFLSIYVTYVICYPNTK